MKTQKMSLANMEGKLSRVEMKSIMAGSGDDGNCGSSCSGSCTVTDSSGHQHSGTCSINGSSKKCQCAAAY